MYSLKSADGEWYTLAFIDYERMYPRLCKVLELPELAEDPRYKDLTAVKQENHIEELCHILEEAFAKYDSAY